MHHVSCSLHFAPNSRCRCGGFHLAKIAANKCVDHSGESHFFPPFMQQGRRSDLECLRVVNAVMEGEITKANRLIKKDPWGDSSLPL